VRSLEQLEKNREGKKSQPTLPVGGVFTMGGAVVQAIHGGPAEKRGDGDGRTNSPERGNKCRGPE